MSLYTFWLGDQEISCDIQRRRGAKNITMSIRSDGFVSVTYPWWSSKEAALSFIEKQHDWIVEKRKNIKKGDPHIMTYHRDHYLKYKEIARSLVQKKIDYWNQYYQLPFNRVAIRNTRSRWGSCSSQRNLNFSYKIIFLSEQLQDYLIVHEICHLQEMNHSKKFWNLVAKTIPDYEGRREALRNILK
jgi:predicted metal-dependent hydrolase